MIPESAAPSGTAGKYGPVFVRNALIELEALCVSAGVSGWRDPSPERIKELAVIFMGGGFGLTVMCGGAQILEKEHDGKKIIDDGFSTVSALLWCKKRCRVR